jgi:hypothetical protein
MEIVQWAVEQSRECIPLKSDVKKCCWWTYRAAAVDMQPAYSDIWRENAVIKQQTDTCTQTRRVPRMEFRPHVLRETILKFWEGAWIAAGNRENCCAARHSRVWRTAAVSRGAGSTHPTAVRTSQRLFVHIYWSTFSRLTNFRPYMYRGVYH